MHRFPSRPVLFTGSILLILGLVGIAAWSFPGDLFTFPTGAAPERAAPSPPARVAELPASLPAAFIENRGQWAFPAGYLARLGPMTVFCEERGWLFTLGKRVPSPGKDEARSPGGSAEPESSPSRGVAVRMRFTGSQEGTRIEPGVRLPGRRNYFLGRDPARWRTGVPAYASLLYRDLHPGLDLRLREGGGRLEYDLLLAPGADLSRVRVRVEGARRLALADDGTLVMETALGEVRQPPPRTWEVEKEGERHEIECRYVLLGRDSFGFRAPGWEGRLPLTIDPQLVYSTFLGGPQDDEGLVLATDKTGMATVAGSTLSPTFPTTTGAYDTTHNGLRDVFLTRFDPMGRTLLFSTFIGGGGDDACRGIDVHATGLITLACYTKSNDYPTTSGVFDTTYNGDYDIALTRLNAQGNALVYSTYIGGTMSDSPRGLHVDAALNATLSGQTQSTDFPTSAGAYDTTHNGGQDVIALRMGPVGRNLVFSTYIGGSGSDYGYDLDVGPGGETVMTGYASKGDYPVTPGAYDTTWNGKFDAFVTSLAATGKSLVFSSFLGGSGNDIGHVLRIDGKGVITLAGESDTGGFPTTPGAFDTTEDSPRDVFVSRLNSGGTKLIYSTFIAGNDFDSAYGLDLEADGTVVVTGQTRSSTFPATPGAFDTSYNGAGQYDSYAARLGPLGRRLFYCTYLGSSAIDYGYGMVSIGPGQGLVTGRTQSSGFPVTTGSYDTTHNGGSDAFVTRLDLHPDGVARFGHGTAACQGDPTAYVLADAKAGSSGFGFACWKAPPSTAGFLLVGLKGLPQGLPLLGFTLWVDPSPLLIPLAVGSDAQGTSNTPLSLPAATQGGKIYAQYIWANTAGCGGLGTISASDALEITVQ